LRSRIGEVERHPVEAIAMADHISARATKSTGTTLSWPPSKADQRHPRRDRVAQALDQLEGVVGPSMRSASPSPTIRSRDRAGDPIRQPIRNQLLGSNFVR